MTQSWEHVRHLLSGPLAEAGIPWPLTFPVLLCDLRLRFLPKGAVAPASRRCSSRAISRNGRILLCTHLRIDQLTNRPTLLRLQTWHKVILPGDDPAPYGILLHARPRDDQELARLWTLRLIGRGEATGELRLDVGGGLMLGFHQPPGTEPVW